MDSAANGPTWMYVAIGALTLLQVVAGAFLARATSTVDKLADAVRDLSTQAAAEAVKVERAEEEIAALRKRVPHTEANREHAERGGLELQRLLLEELRLLRADRQRGAA